MSEVRWQECHDRPGWFEMFLGESGQPCDGQAPRRLGLGDWLASLLYRLGFRKRPGCGCERRQAALNRFGERIARLFRSILVRLDRSQNTLQDFDDRTAGEKDRAGYERMRGELFVQNALGQAEYPGTHDKPADTQSV